MFGGLPIEKVLTQLKSQLNSEAQAMGIKLTNADVTVNGQTPVITGQVDTTSERDRLVSLINNIGKNYGITPQVNLGVRNPNPTPTPQPIVKKQEEPKPVVNVTEEEDQTYEAKKGDSFWAVAEKFYGDGTKYKILQAHNNSEHLRVGDVLRIPSLKSYIDGEKLQVLLTGLGHDTKGIDGKVGRNTESALKAFQTDQGLEANGELNSDTKRALRVQFGQKVQQLDGKVLQILLREAGHSPGKIDGVTGRNTEKAIRAFQTDQGLEVTGTVNANTAMKLVQAYV